MGNIRKVLVVGGGISGLTLAIALLKAIAYEIYVLGPERAERTTYVLGLADRFKPGIRGGSAA